MYKLYSQHRPHVKGIGIHCLFSRDIWRFRLYQGISQESHNGPTAAYVSQEANVVLWQKAHKFDLDTNFDAWAVRIAKYQVMAYRKRLKRNKITFDDELIGRLADEAEDRLAQFEPWKDALRICLTRLKPDQRKLIAQRYEPGACVNDMAAACRKSPTALSEVLRRISMGVAREKHRSRVAASPGPGVDPTPHIPNCID